MRRVERAVGWAVLAAGLCLAVAQPLRAHKPITSPFTYNEHVYPVVRAHCGRCHHPDGPAPMSLLTHEDAAPWAESIAEQLMDGRMPPHPTDARGPQVRGAAALPAGDLDILLTWATGGAPPGDPAKAPPAYVAREAWPAGTPDLTLPLPEQVLAGKDADGVRRVTVTLPLDRDTWLDGVDLRPGTATMLRSAVVEVVGGPTIQAWSAGEEHGRYPGGAKVLVKPGATLSVTLSYKKNWRDDGKEKRDASMLGLYAGDAPVSGRGMETTAFSPTESRTLSRSRILAIRPSVTTPLAGVLVEAVVPGSGRRTVLLRLDHPFPGWDRFFWLMEPIEVPDGTRIEASALPGDTPASGEQATRIPVMVAYLPF